MKDNYVEAREAYNKIAQEKIKYGTYHKTIFHLHTPQSFDHKLKSGWSEEDYFGKEWDEIKKLCIKAKVFPDAIDIEKIGVDSAFKDRKEWLSFLLLADTLLKEQLEIVLVADHNTIGGIDKLKTAIKSLAEMKAYGVYTHVIAGIEISCADRLHVVGIFDDNSAQDNQLIIKEWLDKYLLSEKDGTYKTSLDVINFFKSIHGIAYIAHINTADIYSDHKYLSGAFKNTLFASENLNFIGINECGKQDNVKKFINLYRKAEINFILDNDAHTVDDIEKNVFWIKGSKINYGMVKEALYDYDVSISFHREVFEKKFIQGIYIPYSEYGFLSNTNSTDFVLKFSDSLNCLIGGRGTGKSTILQLIDYVLGQRVNSDRELEFLCRHRNSWILFSDKDKEYLIEMVMPVDYGENIMNAFGQNESRRYYYNYCFHEDKIREYALKKYVTVFEITKKEDDTFDIKKVANKRSVLDSIYDRNYSINELVKTASGEELNSFIYQLLLKNKTISDPRNVITARSKIGVLKTLNEFEKAIKRREGEINAIIKPFNDMQKGALKIEYSRNEIISEPPIDEWLWGRSAKPHQYYKGYNITEQSVKDYILNVFSKYGMIEFIKCVIKDIRKIELPIIDFAEDYSSKHVEKELKEITENNQEELIKGILNNLITESNYHSVIDYLKSIVRQSEKFSLLFNINSNEAGEGYPKVYKNVLELSLGQKVVAMLNFVLGYGKFVNDYRPLILDQPEDNLDSQYIYNNLVVQLRETKNERQIIIATHNATIVTNAMSDQVCVMGSDGKHGWVETKGYPSENRIKRNILNYLEGGIDSFKHKAHIYKSVL